MNIQKNNKEDKEWKIERNRVKKIVSEKFKISSLSTDIKKIVLNSGLGKYVTANKESGKINLANTKKAIEILANQKPIQTYAHKSITGFQLRENEPIGYKVTLRREKMWIFLLELINKVFPNISNFRGLSIKKFGKDANYSFGLKSLTVFSNVPYNLTFEGQGLQITIVFKNCHSSEEKNKEINNSFLSYLKFPLQ